MSDYRVRILKDKEVVTCSHGKQLNVDEIVGKCRICKKYTCAECNVDLPGSSIIGYYCKNCLFKLSIRIFVIIIFSVAYFYAISKFM